MKVKSISFMALLLTLTSLVSCTKKRDLDSKVLNLAVSAKIKGMDPIYANDLYSSNEVARVYEGLLEYHYLKRPYELSSKPCGSMPTVSKDGLTYTFKLRKGVLFQDDVAFAGGKGRELVATDVVYSIKRLADPKLQSLGWWILDGKIKGLNEWRKKYAGEKTVNYAEAIEGLQATDARTVVFKLNKPFHSFFIL